MVIDRKSGSFTVVSVDANGELPEHTARFDALVIMPDSKCEV
jgi:hypothetical protein